MRAFFSFIAVILLLGAAYSRQLLEPTHPFNQDVSGAALHPSSASIVAAVASWGTGATNPQIDFSIHVMDADSSTPRASFVKYSGFYYEPDCESLTQFPLPTGGNVEGATGGTYTCPGFPGSDCHVLVVDKPNRKIYEGYFCNQASTGAALECGCAVTFDMCASYPPSQRGERCTSADAAGFSIAALLVTPDEVATDTLDHAIRFILPNNKMRSGGYVHPASHAGAPSGGTSLPFYGSRLRLKASFDVSPYNAATQVILRAMKKYGILLSDGGNLPFTFAADDEFTNKWSALGVTPTALAGMRITDFEVLDAGASIVYPTTTDCILNSLSPAAQCAAYVSGGSSSGNSSSSPATAGSSSSSASMLSLPISV